MARVGTYQRQVKPGAPQGGRVSVDGIGAGEAALGRAFDENAARAERIASAAAEEQRSARLMDAYTQLGKAHSDILSVVKTYQGKDALNNDLPNQAEAQLSNAAEAIGKDLPDDVRPGFKKLLEQEKRSIYAAASEHYREQGEKFYDDSYKGVLSTSAQKAGFAASALTLDQLTGRAPLPPVPPGGTPHDLSKPVLRNEDGSISTESTVGIEADGRHLVIPTIVGGKRLEQDAAIAAWRKGDNKPVGDFATRAEADAYAQQRHLEEQDLRGPPKYAPDIEDARSKVEQAVQLRAVHKGWTPERLAAERVAALTDLHLGVIEQLRSPSVDRAADAKAYLDAHRGEIDAVKAATMDREIGPAALTDKARRIVDGIEALPTEEARAKATLAIKDEHLGKRVGEILKERATLLRDAKEHDEKGRFGSVVNAIEKGVRTTEKLEKLPAFGSLNETDQGRAREHLRQIVSHDRSQRSQEKALAAEERRRINEANTSAERAFLALPAQQRAELNVDVEFAGTVGNIDGINILKRHQLSAQKEWQKDRGVSEKEFTSLLKSEVSGVLTDKRDVDSFAAWVGKKRSAWLEEKGNEGQEPPRPLVLSWMMKGLEKRDTFGPWNAYAFQLPDDDTTEPMPQAEQPYYRNRPGAQPPSGAAPAPAPASAPAVGVPSLLARPPEAPRAPATSVESIPPDITRRMLQEYGQERPGQPPPGPKAVLARYNLGLSRGEW